MHRIDQQSSATAAGRRSTHLRVIAMALLFLSLTPAFAQQPGSIAYSTLRKEYFQQEQKNIQNALRPCGCISRDPLPTLDSELPKDSTPTEAGADMVALHAAEQSLFKLMHELFLICTCVSGVDIVNSAAAARTTVPKKDEYITVEQADQMANRVRNVLSLAQQECCNPANSNFDYIFVNGMFTYDEARSEAEKRGGALAVVATRSDAVKAYDALLTANAFPDIPKIPEGNEGKFAWIGMQAHLNTNSWWWEDGNQAGPFLNWGIGEPGEIDGRKCVAACISGWQLGTKGQWNALQCGNTMPLLVGRAKAGPNAPASNGDYKPLIIVIAVLLGLFLLASFGVVVKRVVGDARGQRVPHYRSSRRGEGQGNRSSSGGSNRRSARRSGRDQEGGTEMENSGGGEGSANNSSSHPPSRRRVRFPRSNADNTAGGRADQYRAQGGVANNSFPSGSGGGGGGGAPSSSTRQQGNARGAGSGGEVTGSQRRARSHPRNEGGSSSQRSATHAAASTAVGAQQRQQQPQATAGASTQQSAAAPRPQQQVSSATLEHQRQQKQAAERAKKLQLLRQQREQQKRAMVEAHTKKVQQQQQEEQEEYSPRETDEFDNIMSAEPTPQDALSPNEMSRVGTNEVGMHPNSSSSQSKPGSSVFQPPPSPQMTGMQQSNGDVLSPTALPPMSASASPKRHANPAAASATHPPSTLESPASPAGTAGGGGGNEQTPKRQDPMAFLDDVSLTPQGREGSPDLK